MTEPLARFVVLCDEHRDGVAAAVLTVAGTIAGIIHLVC